LLSKAREESFPGRTSRLWAVCRATRCQQWGPQAKGSVTGGGSNLHLHLTRPRKQTNNQTKNTTSPNPTGRLLPLPHEVRSVPRPSCSIAFAVPLTLLTVPLFSCGSIVPCHYPLVPARSPAAPQKELLGELQLSFVLFVSLSSLGGFRHWQAVCALLCRSGDALKTDPGLFTAFIRVREKLPHGKNGVVGASLPSLCRKKGACDVSFLAPFFGFVFSRPLGVLPLLPWAW